MQQSMSPIWIATIDVGAAFWFYACIRPRVWVKVRNILTLNAMDHSFLLRDEKYLRGCRYNAITSGIGVVILTVCLIKVVLVG